MAQGEPLPVSNGPLAGHGTGICIISVVEDVVEVEGFELASAPWWSFAKTVLAAAALALVADGRLSLDAPVRGRSFTLRHLLQHRAGLPEYGRLAAYHEAVANGETPWTRDEMLRQVQAEKLIFEPGQGWAYSNVGYLLVRELIEDTAGQELGAALNSLVLAPLGIAGVELAHDPADLAATAWGNSAGYHPGWVYHGLLVGPAANAALLLHRLLAGALLPAALLSEMLSPHPVGGPVPGRSWRTAGYGLGLMIGIGDTGATYIGHSGGGPRSTAAVYQRAPERNQSKSRRTAAAFARVEDPAIVEQRAMTLACR